MENTPTMRKRNAVIMFAKAAQICRVKTRLWPALSHRQCLYLHKRATQHVIEKLGRQKIFQLIVYTTSKRPAFHIPENVNVKYQSGCNLGQRMQHAFAEELKVFNNVVIVGSDCLDLNDDYITDAFHKLNSPRDIVLGPATDGGYVLIGMSQLHASIFKNIRWGSSQVLEQTLKNARASNINTLLLKPLVDVDRVQDLQALQEKEQLPAWAMSLLPQY